MTERFVQVKNPRTGRYLKIDRRWGKMTGIKRDEGPYEGVPIYRDTGRTPDTPGWAFRVGTLPFWFPDAQESMP